MQKKKILLLTFLLLISLLIKAQSGLSDYKSRVDYIFANVDHSQVSTGLLSDYGLQIIPPEYYDGVLRDSNEVDIKAWRKLYAGMDYSRFNGNCYLPGQNDVFNAIASSIPASSQPVPLVTMLVNYNRLRDDAYTSGLVTINNDQIFNVSGNNPYETKTLFAVAPVLLDFNISSIQFVLSSNLFFSNYNKSISTVRIDMGDGNGFRNITWNQPFSVAYSSSGIKTFIVDYIFSDGTELYSHGKINVLYVSQLKSGRYYYPSSPIPIPATDNHSGAALSICSSHDDGGIHKPIIVAKGFDPWKVMHDPYMQYTVYDFLNINGKYAAGNIDIPITGSTYPTLESYLMNNGYDIVFVNYNDGTDDIKRNAALFEYVIRWVNEHKVENNPNVVLGISMGGLVARYALKHLEQQGYDHQAKVYISLDSPHNGANVPVGVQTAVYDLQWLNNVLGMSDDLNYVYNLVRTTAAKQMLIYRVEKNGQDFYFDNSVHQSFTNEIQTMGFPINCYNVAISDGSGSGTKFFEQHAELVNYSLNSSFNWWQEILLEWGAVTGLFTKFAINIIPGKSELNADCLINAIPTNPDRIYHSRLYIRKKLLWMIPVTTDILRVNFDTQNTMVPIDGAPGGSYKIEEFLGSLPPELRSAIKVDQFCFVPAVSALALTNWQDYLLLPLNNYNFIQNGQTNFQNYYTPMPSSNSVHTSLISSDNSLGNYVKSIFENMNSYCTSTTTIQNMTYSKSQTIVGCNLNMQNVNVQNNSNVIFDATNTTTINGPFTIQSGSSVQIK